MRRWLRVVIVLGVLGALEGGLVARGFSQALLNDTLVAGRMDQEAHRRALENDEFVRKITIYTTWIPGGVQDSQQALGRKIARKLRIRGSLEDF